MKRLRVIALVLGASALGFACGGGDGPPPLEDEPGTGGRRFTGGSGGTLPIAGASNEGGAAGAGEAGGSTNGGSAGEGNAGAPTSAGAPLVEITSPAPVAAPGPGILTGRTLDVACRATQADVPNATEVDPKSVTISVTDENATVLKASGVTNAGNGVFTAKLILTTLAGGPLKVECSASDVSVPPRTRKASVETLLDQGPNIVVESPVAGSAHPNATLRYTLQVAPDPLAALDPESAVESVVLTAVGKEFAATAGEDGEFTVDIPFSDTATFPTAPNGKLLIDITATNKRQVSRSLVQEIGIDSEGPTIEYVSPKGVVVGGIVTVNFKVTDPLSGVDLTKVILLLNGKEYPYSPAPAGPWTYDAKTGTFTYKFDSRNEEGSVTQLQVGISAVDQVGNLSNNLATQSLNLDSQPPIVSLKPGRVRQRDNKGVCSYAFDPLGTRPPEDGGNVFRIQLFRVFVWQRTNVLPNQTALFYANPDPDSVYLYLWNADEELLVDKDKNGVCDDISMDIAKDARVQKLAPLKVEGAPNSFGDDPYPNTPPLEGCTLVKPATSAPTSLCGGASDMFRVVGQKIGGTPVTAVYAKPEFGANTCTGRDWEFGSLQGDFKVKEGWICVAARASDEVGNTGVSAPLRLCYDDPVTGFEPSCTLENMPECTKDCTPPAEEDDYFIIDI